MALTIPDEGAYTALERDWIDLEPGTLFPEGQDSLWGQMRAVFAGYLQMNVIDVLDHWWFALDPSHADDDFLARYEQMTGLPASSTSKTIDQRRAFVRARLIRGAFTRPRRNALIELFIIATFGPAIEFTPDGIPFVVGGIPFFSGVFDLTGTYVVEEHISTFSFTIHILDSIDIDVDGLTREMKRISPYAFDIDITPVLP